MQLRWIGLTLLALAACDDDVGPSNPPGGTSGGGAANTTGLPCDVQEVLETNCQLCHGNPPTFGAPMPLMTRADFAASSAQYPGSTVAQRVLARISADNPSAAMPPPSQDPMPASDANILKQWINSGLRTSSEACETGGRGPADSPGFGTYTPPDSECDYIQELRAHGGQSPNDTSDFTPRGFGTDFYEVFYHTPKWTEKVHTIRIDPIIDNATILHHWLLYMEPNNGRGNGTHQSNIGLHSANSQLLSGWAPGNKSIPLGREVGMQTIQGPNARFAIEIHYNMSANPVDRGDRSGARLCVTRNLRPREASVHWLGTQAIVGVGRFNAAGNCSVKNESHIISYSPHMHETGIHMSSIITRSNGSKETIVDKPFGFTDQQIFPVENATGEIVVRPGDKILTTCTYNSPGFITFGPATSQEMCYNFVVAWPAGSLSNGIPGLVGGKNTCIDGL